MPTLLSQVIDSEKQHFLKSNHDVPSYSITQPIDDKGNVIFNIPSNSETLSYLMGNPMVADIKDIPRVNASSYLHNVTQAIYKPTQRVTFVEALRTAYSLHQSQGPDFAGLLLKRGSTLINPLHPLTALSALDMPSVLEGNWSIILYFYHNRRDMDKHYRSDLADFDDIDDNITHLLRLYASKSKSREVIVESSRVTEQDTIRQSYRATYAPGEERDADYFISTHQLLTDRIVAPYYGTSVVRVQNRSRTAGMTLSPAGSANIGFDQTFNIWRSVCTGNTPSARLEGLKTLTHANLSSPMDSQCINPGSLPYFDACIQTSFDIYAQILPIKD